MDVKKYVNRDVKIFKRGATVIPGGTFILESRVRQIELPWLKGSTFFDVFTK